LPPQAGLREKDPRVRPLLEPSLADSAVPPVAAEDLVEADALATCNR
jgi:hypothetical protein